MSATASDSNEVIVCRITRWYYRRMGLLAVMFLAMGLYFVYDGWAGYPRQNEAAAQKEWFEREIVGGPGKTDREIESYEEAQKMADEHLAAWMRMAREKRWIISPTLKEPRWVDYAAPHNWPENPKHYSADQIRGQFYWAAVMLLGAAITGALILRNHNKVLTGYPDHMVMPNGVTVRYGDVICVDKRKWDHKGLASIDYRETADAPIRRVTVDDMMYGGAEKVLNRLLSQFKGELIEKVPEENEGDPEGAQATRGESPPNG